MDEEDQGDICGGEGGEGSVDEVACDTCGGGQKSMDDTSTDISELGIQGRPRSWGESLNCVSYSDTCDGY